MASGRASSGKPLASTQGEPKRRPLPKELKKRERPRAGGAGKRKRQLLLLKNRSRLKINISVHSETFIRRIGYF